MDWKIFLSTFCAFFLAEFGDKTQIVAITMSAKTGKPLTVFCGAVLALAAVTCLGVILGQFIPRLIPAHYVHKGAAVFFILIGMAMLWGKL